MKNKKKILLTLLVGVVLFLIYRLIVSRRLGGWESVPNTLPEEGGGGLSYQLGCGGSNFSLCSGLSMSTPLTNVGCCGDAVGALQDQLILLGQPITKDGMYGALTKDAHQNALDAMGGTWNVEVVVTETDTNTQTTGVDANGDMWYIDPYSGATIYV